MQRAGGATTDEGLSISIDASSNTYTTGYFTGNAKFGSTTLNTLGVSDIFVTKTDANGNFQWAVKGGDGGSDRGLAIASDANGNSYVTGYYYGIAKFGASTITNAGLQDVFVAKYDANGNLKWVVSGGGSLSDIGNAIAIDNKGDVVIAGQFTGRASFGTFVLNSTAGNANIFTAKLDSANGNFLWAKSGTGPHTDRALGVACDPTGNVYVTGQFTDTITFDNVHYSPLFNGIFLVKYNSSGLEQWFTTAGGGISNIANAIAADNNSNVYITGDFTGSLTFFSHTLTTITNIYSNKVFIAKYDATGNLTWAVDDGSSNLLTSRSISVDGAGNPYIIGNFECIMNGYADRYGQGTFNTVGFWDIFTSEYSATNGAWQWSRQIGGHKNNYGNGIAVNSAGNVFTVGSFDMDMILPTGSGFIGYNTLIWLFGLCNNAYCSDANYGQYAYFNTKGNLDIFIAAPIDTARQTYDYYLRNGSGCDKSYKGVCINNDNPNNYFDCKDTISFCGYGNLLANSNTCHPLGAETGPDYTYLWSTGATINIITVITPGWYNVTQSSVDGCFKSKDSVYVNIHPLPAPNLSDNVVINTNATITRPINLCQDSCILTGGNYAGDSIYWTGPVSATTASISVRKSGVYCFNVKDPFGCTNEVCVVVTIDSLLPKIVPKLICEDCSHDTAFICKNSEFDMFVYDTISNPFAINTKCIPPAPITTITWTVTPNTISYAPLTNCAEYDNDHFLPADSGWYNITATITRQNFCDTNVMTVSDSIYVRLLPQPNITISGQALICPGASEWLVASGGTNYNWSTGSTNDSIYVTTPGYYFVTSTNIYNCGTTLFINVQNPPQPNVTMNPSSGVICPGDSVKLTCSGTGNFQWQGPTGPIGGNTNVIYVNAPGSYNCVLTDSLGCLLLSNTVTITQYSTPFLYVSPSTVMCAGDTAKIFLIAPTGATINWLPPLSGSDTIQYVTTSGTYSCTVISCGITSTPNVTITFSNPVAAITASGPTNLCAGDSVTLSGNSGLVLYTWTPGGNTNQSITVSNAGTYTLTTEDTYGCSASNTITINKSTQMHDTITSKVNVACFGSNSGSITVGVSGGTPSFTYTWSSGGGTGAIATGLSAGTYTITITDAYGCTQTISTTLTEPATPLTSTIPSSTSPTCFGDMNGTASASASGGVPSYSYSWSPGGNTYANATGLSAGTYTVYVTDSTGCSVTSTVVITQPAQIIVAISGNDSLCKGKPTVLSASGATTYLWSDGSTTSSVSVSITASTTYWVIGTTGGCSDSSSVKLFVYSPLISYGSPDDSICPGQSATIKAISVGGKKAYSYAWNNGITNNSAGPFTVSPTATTTYFVNVSDGCGNTVRDSITVFVSSPGNVSFYTNPDTIQGGQLINFINTSTGITNYYWTFGDGGNSTIPDPNHIFQASGNYEIILIGYNSLGCADTAIKDIYVTPEILIPNVFTPNGDGNNDILLFKIGGATCYHCIIYNRWGASVFETNDINTGWNGKIHQTGSEASDGVYYYVIDYCDEKKINHSLDGFVQLIRSK